MAGSPASRLRPPNSPQRNSGLWHVGTGGNQHKRAERKWAPQCPTRPSVPFCHRRWDTKMPVGRLPTVSSDGHAVVRQRPSLSCTHRTCKIDPAGNADNAFMPIRGIRQGDPLPPALFALVASVLVYQLRSLNRISIYVYADDFLLFIPGKQELLAERLDSRPNGPPNAPPTRFVPARHRLQTAVLTPGNRLRNRS